ncbi:MAG: response regulator, partial [Oscillospiraceae bacterium]|nr:response regulator [Oscillospiraceae bacterium]
MEKFIILTLTQNLLTVDEHLSFIQTHPIFVSAVISLIFLAAVVAVYILTKRRDHNRMSIVQATLLETIELCGALVFNWDCKDDVFSLVTFDTESMGMTKDMFEGTLKQVAERVVNPDDHAPLTRIIYGFLERDGHDEQGRTRFDTKFRMRNFKTGGWVWFQDYGMVMSRDKSGKITALSGGLVNIDAAEKELSRQSDKVEEQRKTAEAIFVNNPGVCAMFDDNFDIINCNDAFLKFFRYKDKAEAEDKFFDDMPNFGMRGFSERLENASENGYEYYEEELTVFGERYVWEVSLIRIPYGSEFAIICYSIDITKLRNQYLAVELQQQIMHGVFNAIDPVVVLVDGQKPMANSAYSELFPGWEEAYSFGQPVETIFDFFNKYTLDPDKQIERVTKLRQTKVTQSGLWHFRTGKIYSIDGYIFKTGLSSDSGNAELWIQRDVTRQLKYTEQIEEKNTTLLHHERLLSGMNNLANELFSTHEKNWRNTVPAALKVAINATRADNIELWKYKLIDGEPYAVKIAAEGAPYSPDIENKLPFKEYLPDWVGESNHGILASDYKYVCHNISDYPYPKLGAWLSENMGIECQTMLPITMNGEFWGLLLVAFKTPDHFYTASERKILKQAGLSCAAAIENSEHLISLEVERQRQKILFDSDPHILIFFDKAFKISYCNPTFLRLLGYADFDDAATRFPADIEQMLSVARDEGLSSMSMTDKLAETIENGLAFSKLQINKNGQKYYFDISYIRISDQDGTGYNVVLYATDVTPLRNALEQAEAATQSKSTFLSRMSHEIRTPLNAVLGMAQIGTRSSDIERKDYAFKQINEASAHLLGIINDILDISKIESGKLELAETEFDLESVFKKAVNIIMFRAAEKSQKFTSVIDKELSRLVIGDDQRFVQVLINLLSNAVKFTDDGGEVSISAKYYPTVDGYVRVQTTVTDTGIGITPEQQSKLFTSFVQADSGITRKFGGTGLGLAISKYIAELMLGNITIESEIGKGTSFIFTAILKLGAEKTKTEFTEQNSVLRILAVDDDSAVREYFEDFAEANGLNIETADSGETALDTITERGGYDIYFVDWRLPGMDGVELARRIRAVNAGIVIMISGADIALVEKETKDIGVAAFLPKPLFSSDIIDC